MTNRNIPMQKYTGNWKVKNNRSNREDKPLKFEKGATSLNEKINSYDISKQHNTVGSVLFEIRKRGKMERENQLKGHFHATKHSRLYPSEAFDLILIFLNPCTLFRV